MRVGRSHMWAPVWSDVLISTVAQMLVCEWHKPKAMLMLGVALGTNGASAWAVTLYIDVVRKQHSEELRRWLSR